MDLWDREALDLVAPAFIEFRPDNTGRFGFIAVKDWIGLPRNHHRRPPRCGVHVDGNDECDRACGRGCGVLKSDGSLHGHIYFHMSEDSAFQASRE